MSNNKTIAIDNQSTTITIKHQASILTRQITALTTPVITTTSYYS